jgi:hypothetical protein
MPADSCYASFSDQPTRLMPKLDIAAVRKAVETDQYILTKHAQQRMGARQISHADVKHVVTAGSVIETHDQALPFPKVLFMAQAAGEPLYVACAFDGSYAHIITVHRYDATRWVDPWTRR